MATDDLDVLTERLGVLIPSVVTLSDAGAHRWSWAPERIRRVRRTQGNGGSTGRPDGGDAQVLASWAVEALARRDLDATVALEEELAEFMGAHPDLAELGRTARRGNRRDAAAARTRLRSELREALETDEHARRVLASLLVAPVDGDGDLERHSGGGARAFGRAIWQWVKEFRYDRFIAAFWMTLLAAVPMAVAYVTVWGGPDRAVTPDEASSALLRMFTVWALSFLPGWLYVRFIGERANALWDEYVLHLHRLGLDTPAHLPRPPHNSSYFDEWVEAAGFAHPQSENIYRQKFDAYFGRSVAESGEKPGQAYVVHAEAMFPVFLTTAILATCWTVVLWEPGFAEPPSGLLDILKFAFLGAYAFATQHLVRRFFQSDLRPSAYASVVLRIVVVLASMVALAQLLTTTAPTTRAAIAFVVGFFPTIALQALQRFAAAALKVVVPQTLPEYPLNQLDGLNIWYEARLLEEGIEDMQNLVTANLVDVMLHTRVPVGRLVDWVDQALLYLHLDRTERGFREHWQVRPRVLGRPGSEDGADAVARAGPTPAPSATDGSAASVTPPPPPGAPVAAAGASSAPAAAGAVVNPSSAPTGPDVTSGVTGTLSHGSVNPQSRAGTRSRVALRQVGIRTATDLIKAFPPDEIAGGGSGDDDDPLARMLPDGLDPGQVRTLVRVLDEETDLAPVWNWQTRGALARVEERRPASMRRRPGRRKRRSNGSG